MWDDEDRTPLTAEEEQRCRAAFADLIGQGLLSNGWARFPAYTPVERRRLYDIAWMLSARLGRQVRAEPEDITRVLFTLDGAGGPPSLAG